MKNHQIMNLGINSKRLKKLIASITLSIYLLQPALAMAQPVADPNTDPANRPRVEAAQNGVPVVQITAPSAAGVSRNLYSQFNIGPNGLILNNSQVLVGTRLGGYIIANPNLVGGSARVILNEVTGRDISRLNGYLEVAGMRADVIVANPNGIVGSGFGFINTSRGVLTTGTPIFGGSGSLDAFRVSGGQVVIEGAGLDGREAGRVDIITRAVQVNAGIWANELNVVTGANKVDYQSLNTEKIAGDGAQPQVAIDVAALGGMYASKIHLVGTEQGVGVNSQGTISSAGDLVLTQEGKVINSGIISANGNVLISTQGGLSNQKTIYAQGNTAISTTKDIENNGTIAANQNTAIHARNISSTGTIVAGITRDGKIVNGGDLSLSASGTLINQGGLAAGGNLAVTAADITNSGASIQAGGAINLTASGSINNDRSVGGVAGEIGGNQLTVTANTISNKGGNLIQYGDGATSVTAVDTLDNTGGKITANGEQATIKAGTIDNNSGQLSHAGTGTLKITAVDLQNGGGKIATNGQLNLAASAINNSAGTLAAQQRIDIQATNLTNTQGGITGAKEVSITATEINNAQGAIESGKGLQVSVDTLDNQSGRIVNLDDSDTSITAQKNIVNTSGFIGGNGNVTLTAKDMLQNRQGTVQAKKDLVVNAKTLDNNTGQILSGRNLTIQNTNGVNNMAGVISAAQNLDITTGSSFDNTRGTTEAGANLTIAAVNVSNDIGKITAQKANIVAQSLSNNGKINAGEDLTVRVVDLTNTASGELTAVKNLTITATGNILNQGSVLGDNITASAQTINNTGAVIGDKITLEANSISNTGSTAVIAATGDINILAKTALENKDNALIHSEGNILIAASVDKDGNAVRTGSVLNQSATIEATNDINIHADQIVNKRVYTINPTPTQVSDITYHNIEWYDNSEHPRQFYYIYAEPGDPGRITPEGVNDNVVFLVREVVTETNPALVTGSPAGQILAGGNMILRADTITNDFSNMLAAGTLDAAGANVNNIAPGRTRYITQYLTRTNYSGTSNWWELKNDGSWQPGTHMGNMFTNTITQQLPGYTALFGGGQAVQINGGTVNNSSPPVNNIPAGGAVTSASPALQNQGIIHNSGGLPVITLPANALYSIHRNPNSKYLVETNPRFANYKEFMSSDHMLTQLGLDPAKTQKRLGDGFYEQKLVRDQVAQLSGRQVLSGYNSATDQYKELLNNGAKVAQEFNLQVGVALTAEQMAKLTTDIVWLVEQEVEGQKVLVPVVYLSKAHNTQLKPSGALISADKVEIKATGDINNSGTIRANDSLKLDADRDIANLSGKITGGDVTLIAGRDIRNETTTSTVSDSTITKLVTVNQIAGIEATKNLSLDAKRDISIQGGKLSAEQDVKISAGRNLDIGAVAQHDRLAVKDFELDSTINELSSIKAGGNVTLKAAQDANLRGAQVDAKGELNLSAEGNINISAVKDRYITDIKVNTDSGWQRTRTDDELAIGSTLMAGGNITVTAVREEAKGATQVNRGNITIEGSNIYSSSGAVAIKADNNVTITEATERHELVVDKHTFSNGLLSSTRTDTHDRLVVNQVVGSSVSGDKIDIQAGKNLTVKGSDVIATNDVNLTAKDNVTITTAEETSQAEHYFQQKTSGLSVSFGGGGLSVFAGSANQKDNVDSTSVNHVGSTIGSDNGKVTIKAATKAAGGEEKASGDVTVIGSNVISKTANDILGQDVTIASAINSANSQEIFEYKRSGVTVAMGNNFRQNTDSALNKIEHGNEVKDGRLKTLLYYQAAKDLKKANDIYNGKAELTGQISLSIGSSSQRRETTSNTTWAQGSTLISEGNINITASGSGLKDANGKAADGDLKVIGSAIVGKEVSLTAEKDVDLRAADNTNVSNTNSSSKSVGIGVEWNYDGSVTGFIEGSAANGNIRENGTTHNETIVSARENLTIKSGADTNLVGAQIEGKTVKMDVGGNLNLESQQDTENYRERNSSVGGRIGIGISDPIGSKAHQKGKVNGNISGSVSKTESDYASVTDQTGIYAGDGGFDITVRGNTDLKGAVISSTATPDKNKLDTGTLTWSDIQNKAEYEATSSGVSIGIKDGKLGMPTPNPGMPVSGDAESTTKSAVAPGTIIVGGKEVNPEGLSRDPAGAVNALGKIFDKKTVQERQELAQMFGEVAFEAIGNLHLKEGSPEKATLDAIVGGIISQITGGSFTSGAASAGIHQLLANQLANITDDTVRQLVSYVLGAAVSALTGGDPLTGGSITLSEVRNNWLKHGHDRLIDKLSDEQIKEALKKSGLNLSDEDLKKIKDGSAEADSAQANNSALHAMPEAGSLSVIKDEFTKNMQYAINLENQGEHDEAMRFLGYAIHTVQDIYSHWARGNNGDWLAHFKIDIVDGVAIPRPDNPNNNPDFFRAAGDATKIAALIFASGRNTGRINNEMTKWIFGNQGGFYVASN